MKKILVACEVSQAVTKGLREIGHEAYSCDILECEGENPEWHIKDDVIPLLNLKWDIIIAFPPCTHIAVSGAAWFKQKQKDGRQQKGIDFFMAIANARSNKIAIENPVGIMSRVYRKPDQIIQPYYFGDPYQKTTCLWLKNLPPLYHNREPNLFDPVVTHVDKGEFITWIDKTGKQKRMPKWYNDAKSGNHGAKRSKTFSGIANAMASQWGEIK